ncbi:hypothetical protein ABPG72_016245 [Tetrahymena utriculariae]
MTSQKSLNNTSDSIELGIMEKQETLDSRIDNTDKVQFQLPQDIQEEGIIKEINSYKIQSAKLIISYFLFLVTFGICYLFTRWNITFKIMLQMSKCQPSQAQYIRVVSQDDQITLIQTETKMMKLNDKLPNNYIIFSYRFYTYYYDSTKGYFLPIQFSLNLLTNKEIYQQHGFGILSKQKYEERLEIYGQNNTEIPYKSAINILIDEILSPFYIFQVFSIIIWILEPYYYYASMIFSTSALSCLFTLIETRNNYKKLRYMSFFQTEVFVYREVSHFMKLEGGLVINREITNYKQKVSSLDLVPGDLIEITDDLVLPCDVILLNGMCIMNESILIGESIPIIKSALPFSNNNYNSNEDSKHSKLFAGTKCIETRFYLKGSVPILGLVSSTGFNTMKGQLIRSILYPKQNSFSFYVDSLKFIVALALISILGFFISLPFMIKGYNLEIINLKDFILNSLDLITITVPPALPSCLSIGVSLAISRLKQQKIYCISRQKVNISGKVTIMCFDKTGTLTEEGLEMYGLRSVIYQEPNRINFEKLEEETFRLGLNRNLKINDDPSQESLYGKGNPFCLIGHPEVILKECMASCHEITRVKGEIIGDPLEVKMFEATEWELIEQNLSDYSETVLAIVKPKLRDLARQNSNQQHSKLGIIKRFEFSSKFQRMSVIVKNFNFSTNFYKLYVKGSPEQILQLSNSSSIPQNFQDVLEFYTRKGFRVIAFGIKILKMNQSQIQMLEREEVENDLTFAGLLIMENKLKSATTSVIEELQNANIRTIMVTGDNMLTAISVGRQSKILDEKKRVFIGDLSDDPAYKDKIVWRDYENGQNNLRDDDLEPQNDVKEYLENQIPEIQEEKIIIQQAHQLESVDRRISLINQNQMIKSKSRKQTQFFVQSSKVYRQRAKTQINLQTTPQIQTQVNTEADISSQKKQFPNNVITYSSENRWSQQNEECDKNKKIQEQQEQQEIAALNDDVSDFVPWNNTQESYTLAITGRAFSKIISQSNQSNQKALLLRTMLLKTQIFARMTPEEKALLLQQLQNLPWKPTCGMCGNGANDCAALKTADMGISLSEAEASIAASFTSRIQDISCVVQLLKEGRAALVTSFSCFKFMALYSMIEFTATIILYTVNSLPGDMQFLYWDFLIIVPFTFFMGLTDTYPTLSKQVPNSSLISFPVLCSVIGMTLINGIFQVIMFFILKSQNWYMSVYETHSYLGDLEDSDSRKSCYESTVFFFFTNFQYISTCIAFSISKPFKKEFYTNIWFTISLVLIILCSFYVLLLHDSFTANLLNIFKQVKLDNNDPVSEMPQIFFTIILGVACASSLANILYEKYHLKRSVRILGLVSSTSFKTMKGQLVRSILYPKQNSFSFYVDSSKFILVLAFISLLGFFFSLPFLIRGINLHIIELRDLILNSFDLVTISVPAALPTCLSIGISFAISGLKKKKIYCISPPKVNITGKVTIMCFDKTGTFTEEGLDIYGLRSVMYQGPNKVNFSKLQEETYKLGMNKTLKLNDKPEQEHIYGEEIPFSLIGYPDLILKECMASCHGVTRIKGELIGDPLEVKIFEATEWELIEQNLSEYSELVLAVVKSTNRNIFEEQKIQQQINTKNLSNTKLGIVKRFEFFSKLQRMRTIIKTLDFNTEFYKLYVKGSPEKIFELSKPSSIPQNFHEIFKQVKQKDTKPISKMPYNFLLDVACASFVVNVLYEKYMVVKLAIMFKNRKDKKIRWNNINQKSNRGQNYNTVRFQLPKDIKEEGIIKEIKSYKIQKSKLIFSYFFFVITGGILFLFTRWNIKLRIILQMTKCETSEAQYMRIVSLDNQITLVKVEYKSMKFNQQATPKLYTYYYDSIQDCFMSIQFATSLLTNQEIFQCHGFGISSEQKYQELISIYGQNNTEIPEKSTMKIFIDEVLSPFYIFQVFGIITWILLPYYYYSAISFTISALLCIFTLIETKNNNKKLREMSFFETEVFLYRGISQYIKLYGGCVVDRNISNCKEKISSLNLVPGDLIEIPDGQILPCDVILLNGTSVMNESMLTGESIPVIKSALPFSSNKYHPNEDGKQSTLFAGTKRIETRYHLKGQIPILGLVSSTSFNTTKGQLVRSILYPKQNSFSFYVDSLKFIAVLALISLLVFFFSIPFMIGGYNLQFLEIRDLILGSVNLVTITVPPALPICFLSIGISFAISRLKKQKIFCTSPPKVNISGKVTIMCFDKTGTHTEEGLDIRNLQTWNEQKKKLNGYPDQEHLYGEGNPYSLIGDPDLILKERMASCHGVTRIKSELIGDPLEVKMFEATEWELIEQNLSFYSELVLAVVKSANRDLSEEQKIQPVNQRNQSQVKLGIVKRFEFSSKFQRMSTIVKNLDFNTEFQKFYVKGSPEKIFELSKPSSIPQSFHEILDFYSRKGFRVLAVRVKILKMNQNQIQKLERDEIENNLAFSGLLIMENKLKPITQSIIEDLQEANVRTIMVTGDNALTAISVGRQCQILDEKKRVYFGDLSDDPTEKEKIVWKDFENSQKHLKEEDLEPENGVIQYQDNQLHSRNIGRKSHHIVCLKTDNTNQDLISLQSSKIYRERAKTQISEQNNSEIQAQTTQKPDIKTQRNVNKLSEISQVSQIDCSAYSENQDTSKKVQEKQEIAALNDDVNNFIPWNNSQEGYTLAITGRAFSKIINQSTQSNNKAQLLRTMLLKTQIFARMRPEEKSLLLQQLQDLPWKPTCGMCGDGANDCGALKTADMGISLSEAEASIAAPFTSKVKDISCVIEILREGRAALVTSFSCFKFMASYSMIQFFTTFILYTVNTLPGGMQFLYWDLFTVFSLTLLMGHTEASKKLSKQVPGSNLILFPFLCFVIGMTFLNAGFQVLIVIQKKYLFLKNFKKVIMFLILRALSWYLSVYDTHQYLNDLDDPNNRKNCYESTVLQNQFLNLTEITQQKRNLCLNFNLNVYLIINGFILICQLISTCIAFSIGKPFKKIFYTNLFFSVSLGLIVSLSLYLLLLHDSFTTDFFSIFEEVKLDDKQPISQMPYVFLLIILAVACVNSAINIAYEKYLVVKLAVAQKSRKNKKRNQALLDPQQKIQS